MKDEYQSKQNGPNFEKLVERIVSISDNIVMLKKNADFNLSQILSLMEKVNNISESDFIGNKKDEIIKQIKMYMGRLKSGAREQRKTDQEYEDIRKELKKYTTSNIWKKLPKTEYLDQIIDKMIKRGVFKGIVDDIDDSEKWKNG